MATEKAARASERIQALFKPRNVALVGASDDPTKIGGRPLRYLLESEFAGDIYPINARRDRVQGVAAYPSIAKVPATVDLALIALPLDMVLDTITACAQHGVRTVVLFSAGFAEVDEAGAALQKRITAIAGEYGMRVLGPNCLGAINLRLGMIGTFTSGLEGGLPAPGRIGFVSQSGALGSHCFAAFRERGLGFSYWVTTGNECDIEFADCLAFLAEDPDTDVIAAYIEGCRDGDKLKAALETARRNRKPVVILKVGQSEIGAQAAASHTASLAGADAVYDAVFRQYGVCRVFSITQFMETTYACLGRRFPTGRRIGLMTVSGGVGVMMADAAHALDLDIAPMPAEAQAIMKKRWPPSATANPVDTTAQVTSDRALLGEFLEQMLDVGNYDIVVVFLAHSGLVKSASDRIREHMRPLRERYSDRLILVSALCTPEIRADYENDGLPVFEDPTLAVQIAARLGEVGRGFEIEANVGAGDIPTRIPVDLPHETINEKQALDLLRAAGVASMPQALVTSADAAVEAAETLGYPVVLKIVSPDIAHKSDAGGVVLDLRDADAVHAGYESIIDNVGRAAPRARIESVLVTPMVQGGVETFIGVNQDSTFGPVVAFGLGGIFVETLGDIALRPAPFGHREAYAMIGEIRGHALLQGARGRPRADIDALADTLVAVSELAWHNRDRLESLDINPFVVLPEKQGALALDALIVPRLAAAASAT